MPDQAAILAQNDANRERLKALCRRLYEADLLRDAGDGWTVAAKLAHIAFWDRQVLLMLEVFERAEARRGDVGQLIARTRDWLPFAAVEQWRRVGVDWNDAAGRSQDALNAAALPAWLAVPPHVALRQAVNSAEVLDGTIASLAPRLLNMILASHLAWVLQPGVHRGDHLDQITGILSVAASSRRAAARYSA